MKANEAPEKIILSADRDSEELSDYWVINSYTDDIKIGYIRTDAFIEKACKWLEDNYPYYFEHASVESELTFGEEFRKAMEE